MPKLEDKDFGRLVEFIRNGYGINLEKKRMLVEGRLSSELRKKGYEDFSSYIDDALADPTGRETARMVNRLTTNHTFFMREPEHFAFMKNVFLPEVEENVTDRDLRIWSAGCSTGQEPYTMAMVIDDYFGAKKHAWDATILATDIDTDCLTAAREGIYEEQSLENLSAEWIDRYFCRVDEEHWRICDRIRSQVVFRRFNLMDEIEYKKPFDLISCRNVMIYFDSDTKNALVSRFYSCTKEGGYLFTGHAENVTSMTGYRYVQPAVFVR
ncbi:MAG: protein-glutamate O-methyltransferase CheR [Oscillospiraceae bacterium]|nr:protein-glutamate O-methyltransferase CheR [Oscillospiraceae bacterium]